MTSIRSRAAFVVGVLVFLLAAAPLVAFAASGDLDASFDGDGKVTTAFGAVGTVNYSEASSARAVAIQSNGMIVAAGACHAQAGDPVVVSIPYDFCLARYNADGSLDATGFGTGGKVTTSIGTFDVAHAMAIESDGQIVVAGLCTIGSTNDFCLARYNTNGSLDTGFDTDGKVTTAVGASADSAYAVAIETDQQIVVGGSCVVVVGTVGTNDFCLARYNADGSLDTGFGTGGTVTTHIGGTFDISVANGVAVQGDGRIVAAGYCGPSPYDFCLARYTSAGVLDTTFGNGGTMITDFGAGNDFGNAVAIASGGQIVVAGQCTIGSTFDFCLARYNASGSLDTGFDTDGKVTTPIGTAGDNARAVVGQTNGKLVVAGHCNNPGTDDFCLARYTSAGALDTTFGSAGTGKVFTAIGPHSDQAYAAAIQGDGKVVAVGACRTNTADSTTVICLARYEGDSAGVPTPAEMIAIINAEPLLTGGQKSALIGKLDDAQAAYAAGKLNNACGKLGSFIGQVEGLVPDKLSAATAANLIAGANALKTSYGCP